MLSPAALYDNAPYFARPYQEGWRLIHEEEAGRRAVGVALLIPVINIIVMAILKTVEELPEEIPQHYAFSVRRHIYGSQEGLIADGPLLNQGRTRMCGYYALFFFWQSANGMVDDAAYNNRETFHPLLVEWLAAVADEQTGGGEPIDVNYLHNDRLNRLCTNHPLLQELTGITPNCLLVTPANQYDLPTAVSFLGENNLDPTRPYHCIVQYQSHYMFMRFATPDEPPTVYNSLNPARQPNEEVLTSVREAITTFIAER